MLKNISICLNSHKHQYPRGFHYIPNYVSEEEKCKLLNIVRSKQWCKRLKRQQQYYGLKYFQTAQLDEVLQGKQSNDYYDISELDFLISKINTDFNYFASSPPNQVLVNKYTKVNKLGLHIDDPQAFGDAIVGISLGSQDFLRLAQANNRDNQHKIPLQDKSLYILSEDARYKWMHGIGRVVNGRFKTDSFQRISFTLRNVYETRRKL